MLTQDIKPREISDSAYVIAPFDAAKAELESNGYSIILLEENARLRIHEGKGSSISRNGNWTREGFLILPDNKFYLTKQSPIMDFPVKATQAHRNKQEYYLANEQVQKALENSVQVTDRKISTNRFGEDKLTSYAFGNTAKDYGLFLKDANIEEMLIWLPSSEEKPFARQLWFRNLDCRSDLNGSYWLLHYDNRVRGVRPQNFSSGNK